MNNEEILNKYSKDLYGDEFKLGREEYTLLHELIEGIKKESLERCIGIIGTHDQDEELGYCDTGSDMENACRSECVEMAIKRLEANFKVQ